MSHDFDECTTRILTQVRGERERQQQLKRDGKFLWTCADRFVGDHENARALTYAEVLAVLQEEVGEVAREVVDHGITRDKYNADNALGNMPAHREAHFRQRIRAELIQVAAVCVAWCEALDEAAELARPEYSKYGFGPDTVGVRPQTELDPKPSSTPKCNCEGPHYESCPLWVL